jgi:transposase
LRIARDLLGRCRTLSRSIGELDRELHARTSAIAPRLLALPGCGPLSAAKLLCEIGPIDHFRSDAQLARHAGVAPLEASSGKHHAATASSTAPYTGSRSPKAASTHPRAPTSSANKAKARTAAKRSAASNDSSPAPSTPPSAANPH